MRLTELVTASLTRHVTRTASSGQSGGGSALEVTTAASFLKHEKKLSLRLYSTAVCLE